MSDVIKALILGDVIGHPGCRALFVSLKTLTRKYNSDVVIVNGENAAAGFGITPEIAADFFSNGVDVITSGNHIWQKRDILSSFEYYPRLLRPANYPKGVPGQGYCLLDAAKHTLAVINLQGRLRVGDLDCPFQKAKQILKQLPRECTAVIIDFHAEAPEEKEALGYYLDGKVSVIVGTHTHVQTADERILPKGTAYISDIGMIGPDPSVIGFKPEAALERSLTQLPIKMEVSDENAVVNGVYVEIDGKSGKALKIERIWEKSL